MQSQDRPARPGQEIRDKRGLERVSVVVPVDFGPAGGALDWRGQTYNLSLTGMGIETEAECTPGTRIELRVRGALGDRLGGLTGRIIHASGNGRLHRYGVRLHGLAPAAEDALVEYLWGVRRLLRP